MSVHRTLWYPLTPLSPTPSTFSAMRTPDVQTPGPSASQVDTNETSEETKNRKEPRGTQSTAKSDTQMQYSG